MKRHLILLMFALLFVIGANAQTSLIAVLSHNGEIQTFTGNKALINAYNAAQDGDVITLSPGQFDAISVQKPITIRGGGMYGDNATIINGSISLNNRNKGSLNLEGLAFNSVLNDNSDYNITFTKCYIFYYQDFTYMNYTTFIHCDVANCNTIINGNLLGSRINITGTLSKLVVENCILENHTTSNMWGNGNQYTNCIFDFDDSKLSASSQNNTFKGCVYIGGATQNPMISNVAGGNNRVMPKGTQYLKEGTTTFELLDELQTTWLGTDGKQVGMHGGSYPFDPTTTNPQIKKFDVSSKTSADGKLSVDIEVDIK